MQNLHGKIDPVEFEKYTSTNWGICETFSSILLISGDFFFSTCSFFVFHRIVEFDWPVIRAILLVMSIVLFGLTMPAGKVDIGL